MGVSSRVWIRLLSAVRTGPGTPCQRLAAADLVGPGSGDRRGVGHEILGDDLVGDAEVAIPQVLPRPGERSVGGVGHDGSLLLVTGGPSGRPVCCRLVVAAMGPAACWLRASRRSA